MIPVFLRRLSLFFLLFSLVSCFDFIEEINVNNDGSGEITLTANLSKSRTKIASLMLLDSINGYAVPDKKEIAAQLDKTVKYLQEQNGISNVAKKADFTNFIFSISCNFQSVENINTIIASVFKENNLGTLSTTYTFNKKEKEFSKKYTFNPKFKSEYGKLSDENKEVFDQAFYTCIFRFNDEIESFSNKQSKLSKSKKAIMQKTPFLDLINGKINITNSIKTK